jgi:hypothetical protein
MKNLPAMQRRWGERIAGNDILRDWDGDWDWTKSDLVKSLQRIGMTPNAFIDTMTCSMGAEAVYHKQYTEYMKIGLDEDVAHQRAVIDAEIVFNLSQQSSELPYLSIMQNDRSYLTVAASQFRNGPFSYTRQEIQSVREGKNMIDHKADMIEFETKKAMRTFGMEEDAARKYAHRKFNRNWARIAKKIAVFSFLLSAIWALGSSGIYYCIFGKNKKKKKQLAKDAAERGTLGSLEGLPGGGTIPDFVFSLIKGDEYSFQEESSPAFGLISDMLNAFGSFDFKGGTELLINAGTQFAFGVNPQVAEDFITAGMDFFGQDEKSLRDYELFAMRILQVPQSQSDMIYFDEIDMSSEDAQRMTPQQLAERYATYKMMRDTFFTHWMYDDESAKKRMSRYIDKAETEIKNGMSKTWSDEVNEAYDSAKDAYKKCEDRVNEITRSAVEHGLDYREAAQQVAQYQSSYEYRRKHTDFDALNGTFQKLIKCYLKSDKPEEVEDCRQMINNYKPMMVALLNAEGEEYGKLYSEYSGIKMKVNNMYNRIEFVNR